MNGKLRRSRNKAVMILAALALTLPSLAGCRGGGGAAATPTAKIGMLLPLGKENGTQARKGAELAIRHLNEAYGKSTRFEARWEDDRSEPTSAGTRMEALAADPQVLGVVGPIDSGPAIAAADVANRGTEVLISPLASTPTLARPRDYFFRTWVSDAAEARFVSEYARNQLKLDDVVVLNIGAPYGQDNARAFAEDFKQRGGRVLDTIEYPPDTQNFAQIIGRVTGRSPKALYFVGYPPDMAEVLRELRSRKVTFPVLSAAIVSDPSVAQLAGENVEGVIFPFPATYDPSGSSPAMRKFHEDYGAAFGEDPGFIAAQAYDATMLLGKAIVQARGDKAELPTDEDVQRAVDSTKNYDGATGAFSFDENGDAVRTFRMYEIRGGKMVPRQ